MCVCVCMATEASLNWHNHTPKCLKEENSLKDMFVIAMNSLGTLHWTALVIFLMVLTQAIYGRLNRKLFQHACSKLKLEMVQKNKIIK